MLICDTSQKTTDKYFLRLKEMTFSERLAAGIALWTAGTALKRAAVRRQRPEATEEEITFRVAVSQFGPEFAARVYQKKG